MAAVEELNEDDQKQKYYVFYCIGCRAIFGDSLATASMNKNLRSISLNAVTESVKISLEWKTSVDGEDRGSTFRILECKYCRHPIGRMYDTTPKRLDNIRDLYTLDWNKAKSYQLGQCTDTNIKPEVQNSQLMTHSMLLDLSERTKNLSERVEKLESLVEEVVSEDEFPEKEIDRDGNEKKRKIRY